MSAPLRQAPEPSPRSAARPRLRATPRSTGRNAERTLNLVLELLDYRQLTAAELRVLLAVFDRETTVSRLAEQLGWDSGELRRTGARLYARGLLRRRSDTGRMETVVGITRAGLTTVGPLLTAVQDGNRGV